MSTGILPSSDDIDISTACGLALVECNLDNQKLRETIFDLTTEPVKEQMVSYINIVDQQTATEDKLTDEDIVSMVCFDFDQNRTDSNEKVLPPAITAAEALSALRTLISFQEHLEDGKGFKSSELDMLRHRVYDFEILHNKTKKQAKIMQFLSNKPVNTNTNAM